METEKQKPSLIVVIDIKAINYQNGNVVEARGKMTQMVSGRVAVADEDSLTFRASDVGKSTAELNYNSSAVGTGEKTTNVELDIKGRILNEKKELVDVIATNAQLTKTDAGINGNVKGEDWLKLKIENSCDAKAATTDSYYTNKATEIAK